MFNINDFSTKTKQQIYDMVMNDQKLNKHFAVNVVADSTHPFNNNRLTTLEIRIPRIILSEFNTHRVLSRNFSSSRAIPTSKLRKEVLKHPFVPFYFGRNQKGMSANTELTGWRRKMAAALWIGCSKVAVGFHWLMEKCGVHKQTCNRLIEPWLSVSGTITSTEWSNMLQLREAPTAQPEFRLLAFMIDAVLEQSKPVALQVGQVHVPYIDDEEKTKWSLKQQIEVSVARCCRTSYNNRLGKKSQPEEDQKLFQRLLNDRHFSPFEHIGFIPTNGKLTKEKHFDLQRNFRGWYQYRAFVDNQTNASLLKKMYIVE